MECSYVLVASFLPVRDHIEGLSLARLFVILFLQPVGIYWYLHTLLICYLLLFIIKKINAISWHSKIFLFIIVSFIMSKCGIISFNKVSYFLIGYIISQTGTGFLNFFRATPFSILSFVFLSCFSSGRLDYDLLTGIVIVYLAIGMMLYLFRYIHGRALNLSLYIGQNTLPILLFSPIFTYIAKYMEQSLTSIDTTGIIFLLFTLCITIAGSIIFWKAGQRVYLICRHSLTTKD